MLKIRVIPVLLFAGSGLVKTRRFGDSRYVGDPLNAIRIFNEKNVDELVLFDITASATGKGPNYDLIRECAGECFMPLAYGGGVAKVEHMERLFSLGVEKVIVNTAAHGDLAWIREAVQQFGSQSIVLGVDVKKGFMGGYHPTVDRGTRKAKVALNDHLRACQEAGFGEVLINCVHTDGMQQGYDERLIRMLAPQIRVPFIICGGAGEVGHLRTAIAGGADAVAGGSIFVLHGKHRAVLITYPDQASLAEAFAGLSLGMRREDVSAMH